MQHVNVRVLIVNSVGQLLDFSELVAIDTELFLISRAIEVSRTGGNNQRNNHAVGKIELHNKNIWRSDALRLVRPFITLPAALFHL
ncbi:hypothetical protein Xekk_04552 [Xenorhabdus sp. KK7.4]|nr:hypothetical protein Xekk_04552 [Xenorhabdus sp. KK7.4]